MKHLIIAIFAVWLVCDPATNVTSYLIVESGVTTEVQAQADGSLREGLDSWPDGVHDIKVHAKNIWGISSPAPFSFIKGVPAVPIGVGMTAEP